MKYNYTPNCAIIDYENLKKMFRFDQNGEFETDDPKLIDWIKKNKNFLKPIDEPVTPQEAKQEPVKTYKCKKCEFETENNGVLMAHYRSEHPKKEG